MATTVTQENQDKITQLNAKIKFLQNKLKDQKAQKLAEVETANTSHKLSLKTIDADFAADISALETEIVTLKTQLEAVK